MNTKTIQQLIEQHIQGASVVVNGSEGKFETTVISDLFEDVDMVSRHQTVYAAVGTHISSGALHALSIRTYTKKEYDAR